MQSTYQLKHKVLDLGKAGFLIPVTWNRREPLHSRNLEGSSSKLETAGIDGLDLAMILKKGTLQSLVQLGYTELRTETPYLWRIWSTTAQGWRNKVPENEDSDVVSYLCHDLLLLIIRWLSHTWWSHLTQKKERASHDRGRNH